MQIASGNEGRGLQRFDASRYWQSNVYGAAVAGLGMAALLSVVAVIILSGTRGLDRASVVGAGLVISVLLTLLCLYPGNQIAAYPYAVEIKEGKNLRLLAPLKSVCIPIAELKSVRTSFLALGWIVTFNSRHGLLKSFVIHGGFGARGKDLAEVIQEEIIRRDRSS